MYHLFIFYVRIQPYVHCLAISQLEANGKKTLSNISRLKLPLQTVQMIVKQWKDEGNTGVIKKSARLSSVNALKIHNIIKKRNIQNDGISLNSIAKKLDILH